MFTYECDSRPTANGIVHYLAEMPPDFIVPYPQLDETQLPVRKLNEISFAFFFHEKLEGESERERESEAMFSGCHAMTKKHFPETSWVLFSHSTGKLTFHQEWETSQTRTLPSWFAPGAVAALGCVLRWFSEESGALCLKFNFLSLIL